MILQRQFYLRLMLLSLIAAAISGVVGILFFKGDATARVIGSAALTAIISALMLPASAMAGQAKHRAAGTFAMGAIVIEFLLCLSAIWCMDDRLDERLWITCLGFLLCALPTVLVLRERSQPGMVIASPVGLVLCSFSFILFLVATWWDVSTLVLDDWIVWRSTWLFYLYSVLAIAALAGFVPKNTATYWRLIGPISGAAGFIISFYLSGDRFHYRSDVGITGATSLAILIGYISLAVPVPLKREQEWVRRAAIYSVTGVAFFVTLNAINPHHHSSNPLMEKLTGAAGIVAACSTIGLILLARLNRTLDRDPAEAFDIHEITIICPVCRTKSTQPLGRWNCPGCRMQYTVMAEEPHCTQCGYSLLLLKSDQCPECGKSAVALA